MRNEWGGSSIDVLIQDVRYGLRLIRKAPGFSAVAVASLAAGIGVSTVLFSFVNALLFRPVQASRPEQLVQLFTSDSSGTAFGGSSYPDYEDFRDTRAFAGLVAYGRATATLNASPGTAEPSDILAGLLVSGNYFDVLGLRAPRGRFFSAEEGRSAGGEPVVVLSDRLWRRRFDADPGIAGRAIEMNGRPFTVLGVGPPGFAGTSIEYAADFFVPAAMQQIISPGPDQIRDRRARVFRILGRLAPGVATAGANSALRLVAAQLFEQYPAAWRDETGRGRGVFVLPETEARFASAGPGTVAAIFSSVMVGVLALLAIACVNVATVLLARAATRRREIAVRLAMGASRRRVIRQLLTECTLLAAAGGALGLLIAQSAAALFVRFRPAEVPPFDLTADYRILAFSAGASLLTVVLCGLAPALQATRPDVSVELKGAARTVRVRGFRFNLRDGLVVTQVAVSLVLMIGAALMLRSAHAGRTADPGFRRDHVLNAGIDLSTVADRGGARARFYQEAVRGAAALPAVEQVALAALVPMSGSNMHASFRIENSGPSFSTSTDLNIVGSGYFALLDIPVLQGREFTASDLATSPAVVVVNETMARRFWNGEAVGRALTEEATGEQLQIVGVARDLRHRSFGEEPIPMVYFSAAQRVRARMTLHVRTAAPAAAIAPALQRSLREIDRAAGLTRAETMHEYFESVTLPQRLGAAGAMATALMELALAVMALHGVMAFAAAQRRREIGVRMALGASSRSVTALIMRDGLVLIAAGIVLGAAAAAVGGAALRSTLIGIGPADPVSFGAAILMLLLVGVAASYVPARRASTADPSSALRSE